MQGLLSLSSDIILQIFFHLSPLETKEVIRILKRLPVSKGTSMILNLLYKRLFSGTIIIPEYNNTTIEDANIMSTSELKERFSSDSFENKTFSVTRPNTISFRFVMRTNDFMTFIAELHEFNSLLESENKKFFSYMSMTLQTKFYLDGNLTVIEAPTSFAVIILQVLISLSCNPGICKSLRTMTIRGTDIGESYADKWLQLFEKFTSLETLDLLDNLLRSTFNYSTDLLITLKLPTSLKVLKFDNNYIRFISSKFLQYLPPSLETLLFAGNRLSTITFEDTDRPGFGVFLPHLKELKLDHNYSLTYINPQCLTGLKDCVFDIQWCNIERENLSNLKKEAEVRSVKIIYR